MIRHEDGDEARQARRQGTSRMLIAAAVALLLLGALALAIWSLATAGDNRISLSLYANDDGTVSAQVQYVCAEGPCGEGDRLFLNISGGGAGKPTKALVGDTEITEAVIREQEDGLLVYFNTPANEPGYSITEFPCSAPGESLHVEAIMESDDGETRVSASDSVTCPPR